jgi:hypothetical protein
LSLWAVIGYIVRLLTNRRPWEKIDALGSPTSRLSTLKSGSAPEI